MGKVIKDPIYGYIKIENELFIKIIDSSFFQRLRDIVQTSYISVYPASLHNRFTHSLGVFFLGQNAGDCLLNVIKSTEIFNETREEIEGMFFTFKLACLLHDVGHAPFSHTGETFYFEDVKDGKYVIWEELLNCLQSEDFKDDCKLKPTGAAHEVMSSLMSLKYIFIDEMFNGNTYAIDKEFFVRCIIGLKYKKPNKLNTLRNCFISLLNSQTIDVDRLDYLIRDSYMSGYNSTNIDYVRLLESFSIKLIEDKYQLCFNKRALSVLENAILAHDEEKKWIQSNPTIVYESYLIEGMIRFAINKYRGKNINLFSEKPLLSEGVSNGKNKIRLLSDSDIISFAKRVGYNEKFIASYFDRAKRLKPFWKSEAEYKAIFEKRFSNKDDGNLSLIEEYFSRKLNPLILGTGKVFVPIINQTTLNAFRKELKELEKENQDLGNNRIIALREVIHLSTELRKLANKNKVPFEFVILSSSQFTSSFNRQQFKEIRIDFPNLGRDYKISDVVNVLANTDQREKFFYVYAPDELHNKGKEIMYQIVDIISNFSKKFLEKD